jgi:hypothetical protein
MNITVDTPEREIVEEVMKAQDICILSNRIHSDDTRVVSGVLVEILMLRREKKRLQGLLHSIRKAIANDALAASFQTLGQYRTAVLQAMDETFPKKSQAADISPPSS